MHEGMGSTNSQLNYSLRFNNTCQRLSGHFFIMQLYIFLYKGVKKAMLGKKVPDSKNHWGNTAETQQLQTLDCFVCGTFRMGASPHKKVKECVLQVTFNILLSTSSHYMILN